ncbi:MAG TPA: CopD family protein [Xanthobacteraceae bacterium]
MARGASVLAYVAALLAALSIVAAPASPARAHAALVRSTPPDRAVVALAPPALILIFNEPVAPLLIRVIAPDGRPIAPAAVVAENATVTITPPPGLQPGTHVLSWRVISADGHPVGGSLMFSIGAPSGQRGHSEVRAPDTRPEPGSSARAALWGAKVVVYLGLFIGAGGAFFRAWMADRAEPAAAPWIAAILAAGLIAVPASVALQGLDALDLPLSAWSQKTVWQAGLESSYGLTAIAAGCALLAGLFALAATSPRAARALSLAGLVAAGSALALSGHAGTAEPRLVSRSVVFVHAVCVGLWIGSLLPLYIAVRRTGLPGPARIGAVPERFSRAIVPVIVLLLASGLWLAVVQLERVDALWTTRYGEVLAGKLACVTLLLGLGAANRYWLVPKFEHRGNAAARPFATALALELALALAVLALVALWRFTPPPRALVADAAISIHLHGEKAMAEIEIERQSGKPARASVLVLDAAFQPVAVKEVALVLANPAAGIEPLRMNAAPGGASLWRVDDLRIPVAGRWILRLDILVSDFEKVTLEDAITLPRVP